MIQSITDQYDDFTIIKNTISNILWQITREKMQLTRAKPFYEPSRAQLTHPPFLINQLHREGIGAYDDDDEKWKQK